jgi:ATP-dependent Zn protease
MTYYITIKFLYTITAIIIGTFTCFYYILTNYDKLEYYYSYDEKTTGNIISKKCLNNIHANNDIDDFKCYFKEYTINNVKYSEPFNESEDLITNNKVDILYKKDSPEISMVDDKSNINYFINLFISIIILILLWLFLIIIVLNENSYYNNYIHLLYAFGLSIFISFYCITHNYYNYYNIIGNYIEYDSYTIGIVKDKDTIEYSINNVNKTLKFYNNNGEYDFKVGDKVNLLYNKNDIEDISIYDFKSKITYIVKLILLLLFLLLIWGFLIYNISYILQ